MVRVSLRRVLASWLVVLGLVTMQRTALAEALRWREATDRIFRQYIGIEEEQYVITGVAVEEDKRYLVGQRVDDALWMRLAQ